MSVEPIQGTQRASVAVQRLVRILREKGPMRAGELGVEAWASDAIVKGKPENNLLTMYCRPATKLLYQAEKLGLVRWGEQAGGRYRLWYANAGTERQPPGCAYVGTTNV